MRRIAITDSQIGRSMEDTPEGFLICREVPLARTGEQIYMDYEVKDVPALNGQIIAERIDAEVFSPEAIESFRGKPLTDDHPADDVSPANFKAHLIGTVMEPRRGEGAFANCIVGDLMVYDPAAIAKIKAGKREISCGYDADYEVIAPGRARQINIRGNHVSLVDEGRCGPTCAIRDKGKHIMANTKKSSFMDAFRKVFATKDEAEREAAMKEMEGMMPKEGDADEGDGHRIVLNIGGANGDMSKPRDAEGDPAAMEGMKINEEMKASMMEMMKSCMGPMIEEALKPVLEKMATMNEQMGSMSEAMDDMADPDDMATQDAIARAAILAPGLSRPTNDAKPGSKAHRDAASGFQRAALKQALTTDSGRAAVGAVLGHARADIIARMPGNEVAVAFRAASQLMVDHNTASTVSTLASATAGYVRDEKGGRVRPMNTADLAQLHRDHYAKKA